MYLPLRSPVLAHRGLRSRRLDWRGNGWSTGSLRASPGRPWTAGNSAGPFGFCPTAPERRSRTLRRPV